MTTLHAEFAAGTGTQVVVSGALRGRSLIHSDPSCTRIKGAPTVYANAHLARAAVPSTSPCPECRTA